MTIFCNLTTPADVVQITWQKIQGSLPQNIGTYSSIYGEKILPPYRDRLHCKVIEPNSSFITIREVTFEDEACYKCLFNVFPHGSHGGQICLNIIGISMFYVESKFGGMWSFKVKVQRKNVREGKIVIEVTHAFVIRKKKNGSQ